MRIEFCVYGRIAGSGSKTAMMKSGRNIMVPASKYSKPWMKQVNFKARTAYNGMPLKGPLRVCMTFTVDRPSNHYGTGRNAGVLKSSAPTYPHKRNWPDLTKLVRSTEDAMEGVIFKNDKQVVEQNNSIVYGHPMGVIVIVITLE